MHTMACEQFDLDTDVETVKATLHEIATSDGSDYDYSDDFDFDSKTFVGKFETCKEAQEALSDAFGHRYTGWALVEPKTGAGARQKAEKDLSKATADLERLTARANKLFLERSLFTEGDSLKTCSHCKSKVNRHYLPGGDGWFGHHSISGWQEAFTCPVCKRLLIPESVACLFDKLAKDSSAASRHKEIAESKLRDDKPCRLCFCDYHF